MPASPPHLLYQAAHHGTACAGPGDEAMCWTAQKSRAGHQHIQSSASRTGQIFPGRSRGKSPFSVAQRRASTASTAIQENTTPATSRLSLK